MKQLAGFAIVLLSSVASAQPSVAPPAATPPAPGCSVTIARAPDDVRAIVESWVKAEPVCTVQLELRIVPTDGGYYLLARDEFGRVRERVVPDAQSAGVLVASWMAADSHGGQTPYDIRKPALAPTPPPAAFAPGAPEVSEPQAPGMIPVIASRPAPRRERWLSMGALVAMTADSGAGVRVEWDWRRRGRWTLGFLASASTSHAQVYGATADGKLSTFDSKLLSYLAVSSRAGGWGLRASVGAGIVHTSAEIDVNYMTNSTNGIFPTAEVTLSADRDLGSSWALTAGPVITIYGQRYEIVDSGSNYWYASTEDRTADIMMYLGLRYRL